MTSKRKRLKKLAQSIGVQKNDFDSWLKNLGYNYNNSYHQFYLQTKVYNIFALRKVYDKYFYNNLEKALNKLKISLYNSDKSFRHVSEVFEDLSKAWEESIGVKNETM